jgi:hypothetical protein
MDDQKVFEKLYITSETLYKICVEDGVLNEFEMM